jgi:hypothetical protein
MRKQIEGYSGLYEIDIDGNIYSHHLHKERLLKPGLMTSGYKMIFLKKDKKAKMFSIHRLLAIHFIPNPNNLPQVNHKDGNKLNNSIDNLEWCTQSHNIQHAYDTGLKTYRPLHYKGKFGKDHNRSKAVCCIETQVIFGSYSEASRYYKVNVTSVFNSIKYGTQIKKIKKTFKRVK